MFAQVTSYVKTNPASSIEGAQGLLGLGFSDISSHNFPTPLSHLQDLLRHAIFSMYLDNSVDDYLPLDNSVNGTTAAAAAANLTLPVTTNHSQIIFGGVDQTHYEGCLHWHDLGQFSDLHGNVFGGFWDFRLSSVSIGKDPLHGSSVAIVDSGSTTLVGPRNAIQAIAVRNGLICLDITSNPNNVQYVDCDREEGFDMVATDCIVDIEPLHFEADGVVYTLEKEDLLMQLDTDAGSICLLRAVGVPGFQHWILGDNFMNRYYTVFDFGNKRIGLAPSAKNNTETCQDDWPLDILNKENAEQATSPPGSTAATTSPPSTSTDAPVAPQTTGTSTTTASSSTDPTGRTSPTEPSLSSSSSAAVSLMMILVGLLVVAVIVAGLVGMVVYHRRRRRSHRNVRQYDGLGKIELTITEDEDDDDDDDYNDDDLSVRSSEKHELELT